MKSSWKKSPRSFKIDYVKEIANDEREIASLAEMLSDGWVVD